jgi:putative hydrolase of the HAD superfamily
MRIKAFIIDLDNTIFATRLLGETLYKPLLDLIRIHVTDEKSFFNIKNEMMFKPFNFVATKYHFSEDLIDEANAFLMNLRCLEPIDPFPDYQALLKIPVEKYLVTAGYRGLQLSKIDKLGISDDFKEIHVVDNTISASTKKDVFVDIIERNELAFNNLMVIGDDPESEIRYANELGIISVLYDKYDKLNMHSAAVKISDYGNLPDILAGL